MVKTVSKLDNPIPKTDDLLAVLDRGYKFSKMDISQTIASSHKIKNPGSSPLIDLFNKIGLQMVGYGKL